MFSRMLSTDTIRLHGGGGHGHAALDILKERRTPNLSPRSPC